MKVSIVIPNYNGRALLEKNLPAVINAGNHTRNKVSEIVIVDDASIDDSVIYLKKNYPKIRLIKHSVNRGFAAAVNTGVRSSTGDLICLLNTDVVPSKNFLEAIRPHFVDKKVFGVSLHEKGFGWAKGAFKNAFVVHSPGEESSEAHRTFWVSGGSGVFRRSIWTSLGGLDEKLLSPFYWEDIDICYRALKRGYTLLWEPNSVVMHEHEATVRTLPKRYVDRIRERNQLLFIWKNITSPRFTRRHVRGLFKRIVRSPGYLVIFLMALKKIRIVRRLRAKEKKEAKVSDEAIFSRFQ